MISQIVRAVVSKAVMFFLATTLLFSMWYALPLDAKVSTWIKEVSKNCYRLEDYLNAYGYYDPLFLQYQHWLFGYVFIWPPCGSSEQKTIIDGGVLRSNGTWSKVSSDYLSNVIDRRFPNTINLVLLTIPFLFASIWLGVRSALRHRGIFDRVVSAFTRLSSSLPAFVLALLLLVFVSDKQSLFLPVVALAYIPSMMLIKLARSSALEAWWSKEVLLARAGGLPEKFIARQIIWPQVWRAIAASSGKLIFVLFDAVIIVEAVFKYPGLGELAARAAVQLDVSTLIGLMLFSAMSILLVKLLIEIGWIIYRRKKPFGFS
jgi:peptide/nickel transport system permease protein